MRRFLTQDYPELFSAEDQQLVLDKRNPDEQLAQLCRLCQSRGEKLYIFLDEYDTFANTLLTQEGRNACENLTHGDGFFRQFFRVLKDGTGPTGGLDRLFHHRRFPHCHG